MTMNLDSLLSPDQRRRLDKIKRVRLTIALKDGGFTEREILAIVGPTPEHLMDRVPADLPAPACSTSASDTYGVPPVATGAPAPTVAAEIERRLRNGERIVEVSRALGIHYWNVQTIAKRLRKEAKVNKTAQLTQVPTSSRGDDKTIETCKAKGAPAMRAVKTRRKRLTATCENAARVRVMTKDQGALPEAIALACGYKSVGSIYQLRTLIAKEPDTAGFSLNRNYTKVTPTIAMEVKTAPANKTLLELAASLRISIGTARDIRLGKFDSLLRQDVVS